MFAPFLEVQMSKSAHRCGAKHMAESKVLKNWRSRTTWSYCAWQAQWAVYLAKSEQNVRALRQLQKGWQAWECVRRLKWVCKDACRVAGAVQETYFISILDHRTGRFTKMILHDRCSTSYDLASIFCGRRSTLDRWSGKIAKRIGTRLSALHWTFHFLRKSRWIAAFFMLSTLKNEEVSQNCFVVDTVKFWSSSNIEEVSENCFVFDVVNFEQWRHLPE